MEVEEIWQQLDRLLEIDKNDRTQPQAEELYACIELLVTSTDGRRSIVKRLTSGAPFPGLERFLSDLGRALDGFHPDESDPSTSEVRELLRLAIFRSNNGFAGHWQLLWLLINTRDPDAVKLTIASLTKKQKKPRDLVATLANLDSWKKTRADRGLAILEAARGKETTPEFSDSLERAINWQRSRIGQSAVLSPHPPRSTEGIATANPTLGSTASTVSVNNETESVIPTSSVDLRHDASTTETPVVDAVQFANEAAVRPKRNRVSKPVADDDTDAVTSPRELASRDPLEICIAEASRLVASCFRKYAEQTNAVAKDAEQDRHQIGLLRDQYNQLSNDLEAAREQLRREAERSQEIRQRSDRLERDIAQREGELAIARTEMQKLTEQVTAARQDVQRAHDRAEDDIHHIRLERDHALRTFQSELWDRIKLCLAEVLTETATGTSPSAEQEFFRRRLREIRDTLKEMNIPPY